MNKVKLFSKPVLWIVIVAFSLNTMMSQPVQAQTLNLPAPGKLVPLSASYVPPMMYGLKVFKDAPFKFEFIVSQGEGPSSKATLRQEANNLIKYFLAALAVPEEDMWVNLSPYEKDRIVAKEFGITEMGKELLAQDYLLKQVTASVMYPEGEVGKGFWKKIYEEAYQRFGTTTVPVNTFNKVWIVPDTAVVYENVEESTAVVIEGKLKVMLEEDYLALDRSAKGRSVKTASGDQTRELSNQLIREVILPILEKEVNTGKNFASLRQVYHSLILAFWYKSKLKQSLIGKGYVNRKKVNGVDVDDKNVNQAIYQQYVKSYKKGVYNYIKEEVGPDNQVTPRKYFSGGVNWGDIARKQTVVSGPDQAMVASGMLKSLRMFALTVGVAASLGGASALAADTTADTADTKAAKPTYATWAKNADLLSTKLTKLTDGKFVGHQSDEELLDAEVILVNGKPATKDQLSRTLLGKTDTVSFDLNKAKELKASAKYRGTKAVVAVAEKSNVVSDAAAVPPAPEQPAPAAPSGGGKPPKDEPAPLGGVSAIGAVATAASPAASVTASSIPVTGGVAGQVKTLTDIADVLTNGPALDREAQLAKVRDSISGLSSKQQDLEKERANAAAAEAQARAYAAQEAFKGAEGVLRKGAESPITQETVNLTLAQIRKTSQTPAVSIQTPFGASFIVNTTMPFGAAGQGGRWLGSVQGTVLDINGQYGLNFMAGVPMPMGDAFEIGQILSAPLTPAGALIITDDSLKILSGLQKQNKLGQTLTYIRHVDNPVEGVFRTIFLSSNRAYGFDRNRLLGDHDWNGRVGIVETVDVAQKRLFGGIRNIFRKNETPAEKDARELASPKRLFPWQSQSTDKYNMTVDWGTEEVGFYRDAYLNKDKSFSFYVVERPLTAAVVQEKERDDYAGLIKEKFGYAEGIVVRRLPNGKKDIRIAFRSLRLPGQYREGQIITVTSEETYKANVAKEIKAHTDPTVVGITRSKADGSIKSFHTRNDVPVLNQQDVDSSSTGIFEPTARGSQLQFWLYHPANTAYEVSLSNGSLIGEVWFNKKLSSADIRVKPLDRRVQTKVMPNGLEVTTSMEMRGGRMREIVRSVIMRPPSKGKIPVGAIVSGNSMKVYFDSEIDAFRKASLTGRAIYGVEYQRVNDPAKKGWGQLVDPKTGKAIEVVDGNMPLMGSQLVSLADQTDRLAPVRIEAGTTDGKIPVVTNPGNKGEGVRAVGSYVEDSVGSWGRGIFQFLRVKDYKKRAPVDGSSFDERYNRQVDGIPSDLKARVEAFGKPMRAFRGAPPIRLKDVDLPVDAEGRVYFSGEEAQNEYAKGMFDPAYKGILYATDGSLFRAVDNVDGVEQVRSLTAEQQALVNQTLGFELPGDAMVKIENGRVFIFEPGLGAQQAYEKRLQAEQEALAVGGSEVLELTEDGKLKAHVYAKGNPSEEQAAQGIRSESELVWYMHQGRVKVIHVKRADGSEFDQRVIVPEAQAPKSRLPSKTSALYMPGIGVIENGELAALVGGMAGKTYSTVEEYLSGHYMVVWEDGSVEFTTLNALRSEDNQKYLRENSPVEIVKIKADPNKVETVERVSIAPEGEISTVMDVATGKLTNLADGKEVGKIVSHNVIEIEGLKIQIIEQLDLNGAIERVSGIDQANGKTVALFFAEADTNGGNVAVGALDNPTHNVYEYTVDANGDYKIGKLTGNTINRNLVKVNGRDIQIIEQFDTKGEYVKTIGVNKANGKTIALFYRDAKQKNSGTALIGNLNDATNTLYNYTVDDKGNYTIGSVAGRVVNRNIVEFQDGGKKIQVQVSETYDAQGIFVKALGINKANGKTVALFYGDPKSIDGVEVAGIVALGNLDAVSRNVYSYTIDAQGGYVIGKLVGKAVRTKDTIQGLGIKELESVSFIAEMQNLKGEMLSAFGIDANGEEVVRIDGLKEGGYLIEVNRGNKVGEVSRASYLASKESTVYNVKELVLSAEIETNNMTVSELKKDLETRLNGKFDANILAQMSAMLDESVKKVASSFGAKDGSVRLTRSKVTSVSDGTRFFYRINGDPLSRVIVFVTSDVHADVIINTEFSMNGRGRDIAKAYEFSAIGQVAQLTSLPNKLTGETIINNLVADENLRSELDSKWKALESFKTQTQFVGVERRVWIDMENTGKIGDPSGVWFLTLTRYIGANDPLNRDYVKVDRGATRFMNYGDAFEREEGRPFGVVRGETAVVSNNRFNGVIRQTSYRTSHPGTEYIYNVNYEYRDGEEFRNGDKVIIGYNYKTGVVWEHYIDDEYRLYSRDSMPFQVNRVPMTHQDAIAAIDNNTELDEKEYSTFNMRALVRNGSTYVLTSEKIKSYTQVSEEGGRIFKDTELIGIVEDDSVRGDVYDRTLMDKVRNSPVSKGVKLFVGDKDEDLQVIHRDLKIQGHPVEVKTKGLIDEKPLFVEGLRKFYRLGSSVFNSEFFKQRPLLDNVLTMALYGLGGLLTLLSLPGVLAGRVGGFFKRMFQGPANANEADLRSLQAAGLTEATAKKFATLRVLNKNFVLGAKYRTQEQKVQALRDHLKSFNYFTDAQIDEIADAFSRGRLLFNDSNVDPYQRNTQGLDLVAAQLGGVVNNGNVLEYENNVRAAVAERENEVFRMIVNGADGWQEALNDLLLTPTVRVMRQLIVYLGADAVTSYAKDYQKNSTIRTLFAFTNALLSSKVIGDAFDEMYDKLFTAAGITIPEDRKTTVYETIVSELLTAFSLNPEELNAPDNTGGMIANKYPVAPVVEASTVREFIMVRFIEMAPSDTQEHSIGAIADMFPLTYYIAREALRVLDEQGANAALARIKTHKEFWTTMFQLNQWYFAGGGQPGIFKLITESADRPYQPDIRLTEVFKDLDIVDMFDRLGEKGSAGVLEFESLIERVYNDNKLTGADDHQGRFAKVNDFFQNDVWKVYKGKISAYNAAVKAKKDVVSAYNDLVGFVKSTAIVFTKPFTDKTHELTAAKSPYAAAVDKLQNSWRGRLHTWITRIITPMVAMGRDFWGMGTVQVVAATVITLTGVGAGVWMMTTMRLLVPGLLTAVFALGYPALIFGKVKEKSEKPFWLAVFGAASLYQFGIIAHHVLWKGAVLQLGTFGFAATIGLFALMILPTFISFFQIGNSIKSYFNLVNSTWSKTFHSLVGPKALIRFRGVNWPSFYQGWLKEFIAVEKKSGAITPNGEPVQEYFKTLFHELRRLNLINEGTLVSLLNFADDPSNVELNLNPKFVKANEIIYMAFFALSQKKPSTDVFAYMQATSTHVQTAGELFTHLFETEGQMGSFNDQEGGAKTSLLGYMARHYREEYHAALEKLRDQPNGEVRFAKIITALTNANENTQFMDRIRANLSDPKDAYAVVAVLESFLNEVRPNNRAAVEAEGRDLVDMHLYVARENADEEYAEAVRLLSRRYQSLEIAYRNLEAKQERDLETYEAAFLNRYNRYRELVLLKYRPTFQEATLWGKHVVQTADRSAYEWLTLKAYLGVINIEGLNLPSLDKKQKEALFNHLVDQGYLQANGLVTNAIGALKDADEIRLDKLYEQDKKVIYDFLKNAYDNNIERITKESPISAMGDFTGRGFITDRPLVDVARAILRLRNDHYLTIYDELSKSSGWAGWKELVSIAQVIVTTDENDVYLPFYDKDKDNPIPVNKNGGIGTNLWNTYGRSSNQDAHVRIYPGQNMYRLSWATLVGRNPEIVVVNPMMKIWAASNDAFPVTQSYSVAQETFTSEVQRGRRGLTTFYGKGLVTPQAGDTMLTPPGEDSAAFLTLLRSNPHVVSTQVDWMGYEWGRPSLFAESIYGTEQRYSYNVTRFLNDRGQFEVMVNKDIGYDAKLTNLFLFLHYLSARVGLVLLMTLPFFSMFSAFAYLKPVLLFTVASSLLMEAVNTGDVLRHLRQTGSIWTGLFNTGKDIFKGFAMFVGLIPSFDKGFTSASNESFSFVRTIKDALLGKMTEDEKREGTGMFSFSPTRNPSAMVMGAIGTIAGALTSVFGGFVTGKLLLAGAVVPWGYPAAFIGGLVMSFLSMMMVSSYKKAFPFEGTIATVGLGFWIASFFVASPLGPLVTVAYALAAIAFFNGKNVYSNFTKKGNTPDEDELYGREVSRMFGNLPSVVIFVVSALALYGNLFLPVALPVLVNQLLVVTLGVSAVFGFSNVWKAIGNAVVDLTKFLWAMLKYDILRMKDAPLTPPSTGPKTPTALSPSPAPAPAAITPAPSAPAAIVPIATPAPQAVPIVPPAATTAKPASTARPSFVPDLGPEPPSAEEIAEEEARRRAKGDKAMTGEDLGGIDLGKTSVRINASKEGGIQLNFDDPDMLRLLRNAEGLTPVIYSVNVLTPSMADRFVGIAR